MRQREAEIARLQERVEVLQRYELQVPDLERKIELLTERGQRIPLLQRQIAALQQQIEVLRQRDGELEELHREVQVLHQKERESLRLRDKLTALGELEAENRALRHEIAALRQPPASEFRLSSRDLESLTADRQSSFWSSIAVTGDVLSTPEDVTAELSVGGRVVDHRRISTADEGHFELRHVPESSGIYPLRVTIVSREHTRYDSGSNDVFFQRADVPGELPATLERFASRFGLGDLLRTEGAEGVARTLLERERETVPEFLAMLREIDRSLSLEAASPDPLPLPPAAAPRSLTVLFASWEVPCSRHGGGVAMVNTLKQLAARHRITVVHAYSPEEESWVEEIRPYVSRVVSVPRGFQPASYRGDGRIPRLFYENYTPALRSAVEVEVFSGRYDVVDYEYAKMYSHMSSADLPRVFSILENSFAAKVYSYACDPASVSDAGDFLGALLKDYYFNTRVLPQACGHLVTVTREDADVLRRFQRRAAVYVNEIGVDVDRFTPGAGVARGPESDRPAVVFLGNYRHPPNVDAVRFYAEKVMPEVRRRVPEVEFLVLGSHPGDELRRLGEADGVTVTGFLDDHRPYLWRARAFVSPIFSGAGMRVKILEALACATPVIATGLSMHGIGAVDGQHYLRAENASQFLEATCRLIEQPETAERVGQSGRKLIRERHSAERAARERESIWLKAVDDRQ